MQQPSRQPAVNPLPTAVIVLALIMAGIEGYIFVSEAGFLGGPGTRLYWLEKLVFSPPLMEHAAQTGNWTFNVLKRFVTFSFINPQVLGTLFSCVMLLALGNFVAKALGQFAFLVIFFVSAAFGAFIYTFLSAETFPLMGGFPGVYGLLGCFTFVLYTRAGGMLEQQVKAFQLIGILLVVNLVFSIFFGAANTWIAELPAAILGFAMASVLKPGGVQDLLSRMRQR